MDCENRRKYTDKAARDLREIVQYIAQELCNPTAARSIMAQMRKCTASLCDFPESGSLVTGTLSMGRTVRKKVVGNYVLYYTVDKEKKIIWVLRIVYGRRDMDEVFRKIDS